MKLKDKITVVTGGGAGIGRALVERFAAEGAAVVVADRHGETAQQAAADVVNLGGRALGITADCSRPDDIAAVVDAAKREFGVIDLFCSNAGHAVVGGVEVPDLKWQKVWEVNVMAHVWAARLVLPDMLARGEGYLLQIISAAGLLTAPGTVTYSVTKHAAMGLAEWLAVTHGDQGIRVSAVCPQAVRTQATSQQNAAAAAARNSGEMLEPDDVGRIVVEGIEDERFLILPHPAVHDYLVKKTQDYDRWIEGARRLRVQPSAGKVNHS